MHWSLGSSFWIYDKYRNRNDSFPSKLTNHRIFSAMNNELIPSQLFTTTIKFKITITKRLAREMSLRIVRTLSLINWRQSFAKFPSSRRKTGETWSRSFFFPRSPTSFPATNRIRSNDERESSRAVNSEIKALPYIYIYSWTLGGKARRHFGEGWWGEGRGVKKRYYGAWNAAWTRGVAATQLRAR